MQFDPYLNCFSSPDFDFFSRTTGSILTRLGTNRPWVKGIQVSSKKGDSPSRRGDNTRKSENALKILKKFSYPEPADQIESNLVQIILG
jgi:hypothetical protein